MNDYVPEMNYLPKEKPDDRYVCAVGIQSKTEADPAEAVLPDTAVEGGEIRLKITTLTLVPKVPFVLKVFKIIKKQLNQLKTDKMKMKRKTIYCMLSLCLLSAASVKAQVRIGGLDNPNPSAVLDLNATDAANNGALGLALPRVELTSTTSYAPLKAHVAGMTVYNTANNSYVTPGTYYNDGSKWIRAESGTLAFDGVISTAVIDATSGGGLIKTGSGTTASPFTLGIADNGVTSARIENGAVTADDLATGAVTLDKMATGSVNSAKIVDASIATADLADNSVTGAKIQDGTITADDLASNAVTTVKILDANVTTAKIADDNVTAVKIATDAVTTVKILNANVTLDKLAPNSVNSAKIVDASIATADLANGAVTAAKLNAMDATANQALVYNGSAWAPTTLSAVAYSGGGGSAPCSGAIVYGGAYNGPSPSEYISVGGSFEPNWSSSAFSIQGRDLCWALTDISGTKLWADAKTACAALTTDNRLWRLPNLKELQVLYEAIGGKGGSTTAFTGLDTYGYGKANSATPMLSDRYWSSTEYSATYAWYFSFSSGSYRNNGKAYSGYVRCVRSL